LYQDLFCNDTQQKYTCKIYERNLACFNLILSMARAKFEIKRKCEICGAWFYAKTVESRFCSKKCSEIASKKKKAEIEKLAKLEELVANIPDSRDYISVQEAVAMFSVSKDTIYRLIRKGTIPCVNLGKRLIRIKKSDLENMFGGREYVLDNTFKPLPKLYNMEPENCYTIGEISEKYHVNDSTVYLHIRKYSIPIRQIGNYVYAPKEDIDNLYKSGKP